MIHIKKNNIPKILKESQIYLYGGGYTGKVIIGLFSQNGMKINAVIDDDEGLQGEKVLGIPVISFQEFYHIYQETNNISIVLTCIYGKAILKKLSIFPELKIYELFDWYNEIIGYDKWISQMSDKQELSVLKQEWGLLEKKWADKESIKILDGILKYLNTKDLNDILEICTEEEQYFIPEVLEAIKFPLHIVDGGAYRGELLHSVVQNDLRLEKWYCFEPDSENYTLLEKQASRNGLGEKQVCVKKGLWSKSSKLYFKGGNATGSRIVPYETSDFAEVVSIDEFLGEKKCNFIKMDIEGSELQALRGGMNVIKRERPILAVCIYHSIKDYWEIPKFLMQELENYQYYVRHHALICNETVLYAIPV